jgi:nitroimidazol reductase NimA-like FMN-containing flavoprotein (pyridoxamine 5'-phosphate oxidase superfamily)
MARTVPKSWRTRHLLRQTLVMGEREHQPPSERVRLRRRPDRGDYDPATVHAILDAGVVAHVGVTTEDGPLVLPMAYGRTDSTLLLHGSAANSMLRAARGIEICATVTILDGLVFARTPFHNSMNYRSVVIRGRATPVTDPDEHAAALRCISDHVVANWDHGRAPTATEIKKTMVIALPLDEASAKLRSGDPIDEPADVDGEHWAGTVTVRQAWGPAVPAADLRPGIEPPATIVAAFGG